MTRRMLINAIDPEECRIAIAEEDQLLELEAERTDVEQLKGNVYKARITRIEPSLQAAFLDIGANRNGFLQINDIHSSYFKDWPPEDPQLAKRRPRIQDVLEADQELVVQVVKDEREAKGATLTTNLTIPGRYLVLMVGSQRGGVSRKISDEKQRQKLRQAIRSLRIPPGMGIIVRTAGFNKGSLELQQDLNNLLKMWENIVKTSFEPEAPIVLYKESDLVVRTVRDYLTSDIEEIHVDDKKAFERVEDFVSRTMTKTSTKVVYYDEGWPLFSKFHLDAQVEAINQQEVTLPSGGSIVINPTEAIVAVDVNSGRSTGQADVEETAFATNKEAAVEIAKQLRLRDLGGLVVVDFIDMNDRRHKQVVEKTLKEAVRHDKAKVEMGRISKFGLLEMSRQRLKTSLVSQSNVGCSHCGGSGRVKTPEAAALEALRKIRSTAFSGGVRRVRIHMSPSGALFLLNNKRQALSSLERETEVEVVVYADGRIRPGEYKLELDRADSSTTTVVTPSTRMMGESKSEESSSGRDRKNKRGRDSGRQGPNRRNRSNSNSRSKDKRQRKSSGRRNTSGTRKQSSNKQESTESRPAPEVEEKPAPPPNKEASPAS